MNGLIRWFASNHVAANLLMFLIIAFGLLAGCASVFRDFDDRMNRKRFPSDYASFENALSVYKDGDYRQAIAEGATHVRVGSAIFGAREPSTTI